MLGILDIGTYLPFYRLAREEIGRAWQMEQARALLIGERTVAHYDEDSVTMAAEALLHTLGPRDGNDVDMLLFASTTPPFGEKSSASVVAALCDLPAPRTVDVTGTLRAGTSALALALDAVRAGSARHVALATADMRHPEPGTLQEAVSGDGAVALLVGAGPEVIAEVVGRFHLSDPTVDTWRLAEERTLRSDDEAFSQEVGYRALTEAVISGLLKETGVAAEALAGAALYVPDGRSYTRLVTRSPLAAVLSKMGHRGPAPRLLWGAGNLGCAFALAQLALLLETAQPGDLLALVGYGDGADAFLLRVTEAITQRPARHPTQAWLDAKGSLPYPLALHFREMVRDKPLFPPDAEPWTSLPLLHRERDALLRLHAQRCATCGALWWPPRPACYDCGAAEGFTPVRLGRTASLTTFVAEWAVPTPLAPLGVVTVDTPEGARLTTQATDGDPRCLTIGQAMELVPRRFHTAKGLPHYSWKARPMRGAP